MSNPSDMPSLCCICSQRKYQTVLYRTKKPDKYRMTSSNEWQWQWSSDPRGRFLKLLWVGIIPCISTSEPHFMIFAFYGLFLITENYIFTP